MTRAVWVKADDTVGDWDDRRARITAALEAGADWVLVDEDDVERVRELGDINVAAFRTDGNVTLVDDIDEAEDETGDAATRADAIVVGKNGEGDATIDLPEDFSGRRTSRRCAVTATSTGARTSASSGRSTSASPRPPPRRPTTRSSSATTGRSFPSRT